MYCSRQFFRYKPKRYKHKLSIRLGLVRKTDINQTYALEAEPMVPELNRNLTYDRKIKVKKGMDTFTRVKS